MNHKAALTAIATVLLLAAVGTTPASAQSGMVPEPSPTPEGLKPGTGAPFPKGSYKDLDKLPDWGGIWFRTITPRPAGAPAAPAAAPKLKGKYKAANDAWRAEMLKNDGVVKKTTSNCAPPGLPRIMQLAQYPYEFLFTPGRVTINQEAWMQTRTIWTDGRQHPEDPDPGYFGHAVGHWEGNTLVVDTIAIKDTLEIQPGMLHSDKLHITERIHLKPGDANVLLNEMTLEDSDALEEPFKTVVTYSRDRNGRLLEFQCSENDRNPVDAEGNTIVTDTPS
jgi:hypothetical protein